MTKSRNRFDTGSNCIESQKNKNTPKRNINLKKNQCLFQIKISFN